MEQRQRRGLCQGRGRCIHYQERREEKYKSLLKNNIYQTLKIASNNISIFVGKKNGKKHIVQNYRYLNE